jgi:hypothetical protein
MLNKQGFLVLPVAVKALDFDESISHRKKMGAEMVHRKMPIAMQQCWNYLDYIAVHKSCD